jgi:hypothetical protein
MIGLAFRAPDIYAHKLPPQWGAYGVHKKKSIKKNLGIFKAKLER